MKTLVVIPARYGSTRFPGKPLCRIAGKPMIQRVWEIAKAATNIDDVIIATDDERIISESKNFDGKVLMTDSACRNGTERVYDVLKKLKQKPQIVINFQGDSPLTPPSFLEALIETMQKEKNILIATPAIRISEEVSSCTFVTFDKNFNALYFSRSPIPNFRTKPKGALPLYKHIGIYAYRYEGLEQYLSYEQTPLEEAEGLEQLRALENGMKIRVVLVDTAGRTLCSVDRPEDAKKAEEILAKEGEILKTK